ncbi:hypothetical protein [Veronia pacifica]|uniref:hypothetical protein n=1 Tax=Veronia pacifica TaxID=1080227 RepID=UPI0015860184|nr:hypothetical protein [Veronia pacifica]
MRISNEEKIPEFRGSTALNTRRSMRGIEVPSFVDAFLSYYGIELFLLGGREKYIESDCMS